MTYHYIFGATRWKRWTGSGDVRTARAPKGWDVSAEIRDTHPITGKAFKHSQWWVCETYVGD